MKTELEVKFKTVNNKSLPCYIPKVNGAPVLGEHGFILKYSFNSDNKMMDNEEFARSFLRRKVSEINSFMEKNSKFLDWVEIDKDEDNTFPEEGLEVIVSDGKNYDVAWYIRSGDYKWVKSNVELDDLEDFTSFIPTKWKLIN